jgi:hypothetical protein
MNGGGTAAVHPYFCFNTFWQSFGAPWQAMLLFWHLRQGSLDLMVGRDNLGHSTLGGDALPVSKEANF